MPLWTERHMCLANLELAARILHNQLGGLKWGHTSDLAVRELLDGVGNDLRAGLNEWAWHGEF